MTKYMVRIEGKNVFIRDATSKEVKRVGFFTTRMIEAPEEKVAIADAMRVIAHQLAERGIVNNPARPLEITVDGLSVVENFSGEPPGTGFTFYPDQDH